MRFLQRWKWTITTVVVYGFLFALFAVNVVRWSNCDGDYVAAVSWTGWTCIEEHPDA